MMAHTCCPQLIIDSAGLSLGGSAKVRQTGDLYEAFAGVWPLDEVGHGTLAEYKDRTHFQHDGRGGNGTDSELVPTIDEGVFCQPSQHLDGRQFITVELDTLDQTQAFAVSLWARIETFYKGRVFFSRGNFTLGHSFLNQLQATVKVLTTDQAEAEYTATSSSTLTQETFYHVAGSFQPGVGLKLYRNGVLVGSKAVAEFATIPVSETFFGQAGDAFRPEGNIQEIRLHPNQRSASWFAAEYANICNYSDFVDVEGESTLP